LSDIQVVQGPAFRPAQKPLVLHRFPGYPARMVHVGIGYDVHALVEGRKLILGGVEIPHTRGLEGHSDADALMHAICDAILGALGEPDIGHFFPNTDPRWRNAPSRLFLREAARLVAVREGKIVNIDATVLAQEPKIFPHIQSMKKHIGEALEIAPHQVGVKATTNESLGFIGRGEGIAAMAVASVELPAGGPQ
jgi:2-C-methyl-D-erythritol 2,4-cyclodiphosphate synthase